MFGLEGILKSSAFHLSESAFLNDSKELKYIREVIDMVCEETQNELDESFITSIVEYNKIPSDYDSREESLWYVENSINYILSLSEEGDSLVLWSNYSKNEGYNIEIDLYTFLNNVATNTHLIALENDIKHEQYDYNPGSLIEHGRVIYDLELQKSLVKNELLRVYDIWSRYPNNDDNMTICKIYFFIRMIRYAIFFKNPGFAAEKEYRLVVPTLRYHIHEQMSGFRVVNGCFIPYFKLHFGVNSYAKNNPIKRINIGPKNNLDIAEEGLKIFKNTLGFEDVEIGYSKIPLRY